MKQRFLAGLVLAACTFAPLALPRSAGADQPPLKIGLISTFSGFFTEEGQATDAAVAAFIKEHGDTVAGRKVEIIKRDDGGLSPENARRIAQELIINDKVDFLMGLIYSPNAKAVGEVSTAAKKPTFFLNGGYGFIETNPYTSRWGYGQAQLIYPLADWALKNNFKNVALLYLNFGAGNDSATAFRTAFTAGGGKIVGDVTVPINTTDFSPFIQRIRDSKPQAVFMFLTSQSPEFLKQWQNAGVARAGIKLLATAETNELELPVVGDDALGIYTSQNYSAAHNSKLNKDFSRDLHATNPLIPSPDFFTVATYDALQAIYKVTAEQKGTIDPDRTMALIKGMKFESPRGPIEIDPATRDIIQNIYIRRVDKVNGVLQNTEIAVYPHYKDPTEK